MSGIIQTSRQNSDDLENELDMIFGFLDETEEWSSSSSCNSGESFNDGGIATQKILEEEEDEEESSPINFVENKAFWESQDKLLLANLRRSSSIEAKIRQATKEVLKELKLVGINCICRKTVPECRSCALREISAGLSNSGFNCGICKSKWMNSKDTVSGNHRYLEVVEVSNSKRGDTRVVIELNFRAEFEMARASEEYNRLINLLPEIYVGKIERLQGLIKILCSASKKCAKDRNIHIAPWRKQKYMQAKWSGVRENKVPFTKLQTNGLDRAQKRQASMLTFDILNFKMLGLQNASINAVC